MSVHLAAAIRRSRMLGLLYVVVGAEFLILLGRAPQHGGAERQRQILLLLSVVAVLVPGLIYLAAAKAMKARKRWGARTALATACVTGLTLVVCIVQCIIRPPGAGAGAFAIALVLVLALMVVILLCAVDSLESLKDPDAWLPTNGQA